ncbi:MAG: response regulator transcription factor [Myxococcota bacterium]
MDSVDLVIADKNPLLRTALEGLFSEDERFRLLATAKDGEEFVQAVERSRPAIGIMGWIMPPQNGASVLEGLRLRGLSTRVVIYTGDPDPRVPKQAMVLGAAGFCSKCEMPQRLVDTVLAVAAGQMVFPFVDVSSLQDDPLRCLTDRERDLLLSLSSGRTNAQLAKDFGLSVNTVKFHLGNLYDKLGVRSRAQAVAYYHESRR